MVLFDNPNNPVQPQIGVYVFSCEKDDRNKVIYVGRAGSKKTLLSKGTLFRGISHIQRGASISSNKNKIQLDTDFIVGTVLCLFENHGWICHWRHYGNDPGKEFDICKRLKPVIQDLATGNILKKYLNKSDKDTWENTKENLKQATNLILDELRNELK